MRHTLGVTAGCQIEILLYRWFRNHLVTDRVRSTRGGNVFTLFTSWGGGGYSIQLTGGGGTPSQVQAGGGTPSQVQAGGGGTPSQVQVGGVPHPRSKWGGTPMGGTPTGGVPGVPPRPADWGGTLMGGYPPPTQLTGGGYPLPEQHSVYFLHRGRYASCVHAGGLSCL